MNKAELQRRAFFWDILLETYSPSMPHPSIQDIQDTKLNLIEQRTIQMDIPRTRHTHLPISCHPILEQIITRFCQVEHMSYKQGINEIFGVVAIFNQYGLPWEKVYEYGRKIIMDNNFFKDQEFISLQVSFSWINLLFKFHDYELYDYINNQNMLSPELYATPWILTLLANKMSLECTMLFWEAYFARREQIFIYFIVVAILITYKHKLTTIDPSFLPQTLTGIYIDSVQDIKNIYKKAIDLRINTPNSCCPPQKLFDSPDLHKYAALYDSQSCLTVSPQESHQLIRRKCTQCNQRGCASCRKKHIPQEMRHFINHSKDLQELLEYVGNTQKLYKIIDCTDIQNNSNITQIIANKSGNYSQIQYNCSYICCLDGGWAQFKKDHNDNDDTLSICSQSSRMSSQIIIPFKNQILNKVLIQQQPKKAPEEILNYETLSTQSDNIQNYNYSPGLQKVQPLISKLHKNKIKDQSQRYMIYGLFKCLPLKLKQYYNTIQQTSLYVYKCNLYPDINKKSYLLVMNQDTISLLKFDETIQSTLNKQDQRKIAFLENYQRIVHNREMNRHDTTVSIKSLFYMAFLKKISSKRMNSNVISFYFKQPIINANQQSNNPFFDIFAQYCPKISPMEFEQSRLLIKGEFKISVELVSQTHVAQCIEAGKSLYRCSQQQQ